MTIYIEIDWREQKHDIVFLNEAGAIIGQLTMSHTGYQRDPRWVAKTRGWLHESCLLEGH